MHDPIPNDDSRSKFDAIIAAAKQRALQQEQPCLGDGSDDGCESSDTNALPERIGPFLVKRLIARGGSSWVFEGYQERPPRRVAIKALRDLVSQEARERFEYEARLLARLEHPNVVRIYEVGQWQADRVVRPYIAMEYIGERTLQQFAVENQLDCRERIRLLIATCKGVQYGHQHAIIHRDLKPTNVVVDESGNPKVVDFGVAKAMVGDTTMHTRTGQWLGTPVYMSPEQLTESSEHVDTRTDVYGLGTIGYELLSGRPPFSQNGRALAQVVREICETAPTPLGKYNTTYRGDIETIIATALHKQPSDRYESVAAFSSDLQNYLDNQPIAARRIGLWGRAHRWSRRQPLAAAALCAAVAMAILLLITGLILFRQTRATAERQRQQLYAHNLNLATRAFDEHNLDTARRLLQQQLPTGDEPDLRGFAWYHLWNRLHQQQDKLTTHLSDIYDIQFSSDGERMISCGDGGWCLWDTSNWRLLHRHRAGRTIFSAVRILPDDRSFVTTCFNRSVDLEHRSHYNRLRQWDLETGKLLRESQPFPYALHAVALSPNGTQLFVGGGPLERNSAETHAGELSVVSVKTFKEIDAPVTRSATLGEDGRRESDITAIGSIVALPAGRIATSHHHAPARIWDLDTGDSRPIAAEIASQSTSLHVSTNKDLLAIGSWNDQVVLWDTAAEQVIQTIEQTRPHQVCFSRDGSQIATTSNTPDNAVYLWDTATGEPISQLVGHSSDVWCLAFDPNGTKLISGPEDFSLLVWDLAGAKDTQKFSHGDAEVPSLDVSTNQRWLAYGSRDGTATLCDIASGESMFQHVRPRSHVWGTAFRAGHRQVAFGFADLPPLVRREHPIRLFDIPSGELIFEIPDVSGPCADLKFSSDGRFLAAGYLYESDPETPLLQVWETTSWRSWKAARKEPVATNAIAFSPNSTQLVACGDDRRVRIWDAATGVERIVSSPLPAPAVSVAYSPTGDEIAVGTWPRDQYAAANTEIRILDANTLRTKHILLGHGGGAYGLAFCRDGSILATGAGGGLVKLWDLRTYTELATLRTPSTGWVFDLEFSSDDQSLFATYGSLTDPCGVIRLQAASEAEVEAYNEAGSGRRFRDSTLSIKH